ncbi:MAG TPA: glycosyl transferase, partial [Roseovarius sp.]|nr:glycosyl transferase [Roseovarius sp.]
MGISELRQLGPRWDAGSEKQRRSGALGRELVRTGTVSTSDMALAELMQRHCDTSLDRILRAEGLASEDDLLTAHARRLATRRITPEALTKAPAIDSGLDPRVLLKHGALAIRDGDGVPRIVADGGDSLVALRRVLPPDLAKVRALMAPRAHVQARLARAYREDLRALA